MPYRGAGGTGGGEGPFFIGLIMMIAGAYLLLRGIMVQPQIGFGSRMFAIGGFPVTTGLVLVPFVFGVGMIFYNSRQLAWLAIGRGRGDCAGRRCHRLDHLQLRSDERL